MKYIFIADDSPIKRMDIVDTMCRLYPDAEIVEMGTAKELLFELRIGFSAIIRETPTECLVVLDMCMPRCTGEPCDPNCGYFLLARMQRHGCACSAILVSSEPVDDDLALRKYSYYRGSIQYDAGVRQDALFCRLLSEED